MEWVEKIRGVIASLLILQAVDGVSIKFIIVIIRFLQFHYDQSSLVIV